MILRITDGRKSGHTSNTWWTYARNAAAKGIAPHGINQLLMDETVTHIDMFAQEKSDLWSWAATLDGWVVDGQTALHAEALDSTKSRASVIQHETLRGFRPPERGGSYIQR